MIDAYEEPVFRESAFSPSRNELTLAAIKEYLFHKGGKVKYSELYAHFKDQIVDSTTGLNLWHQFIPIGFNLFFINRQKVSGVLV
jgi:hypothetical protein